MPARGPRRAGERLAQRHAQVLGLRRPRRSGCAAGPAARPRAPRPCTTAPAGRSRRCGPAACVASSATSRPRAAPSLSSSALDLATIATGSSASGIIQGSMSSGLSLSDSVSPVSARVSLATATMSPAMPRVDGPLHLAQRAGQRPDPLVDVVVLVPAVGRRSGRRRARTESGVRRAGEDPHQGQPPDVRVGGRLHDLGAQRAGRIAGQRRPAAARRAWSRRAADAPAGAGKPRRTRSSTSAVPEAAGLHRGADHRVERAAGHGHLQVGRRAISVSMCSPPR